MVQAGVSQKDINAVKKELQDVAGKDCIISGSEFNNLFKKLDAHDKNGSNSSFAVKNSNGGLTLCGAVTDVLKQNRTTSVTYSKTDFTNDFQAGEVKIDTAFLSKVFSTLGKAPYNLTMAERNTICANLKEIAGQDGSIAGNELDRLFKEISRHDVNGSDSSFLVSTINDETVKTTVSGKLLGLAQDQYVENVALLKDDIFAALQNCYLDITDISIGDQISLTALGVSIFDMKGCCDKLFSLTVSDESGKTNLFNMLDRLDGDKDGRAVTDQKYIGKAATHTKAGKAWDILKQYIKSNDNGQEGVGKTTVEEPAVKQDAAHFTADNAKVVGDWLKDGLTGTDNADIAANRKLIEERVELKGTSYKSPSGSVIKGNVYYGDSKSDPTPTPLKNASNQAKWIYQELAGEGGATAVNTYDGQLFTFGRGFAGKSGGLTGMLTKWFANEDVAAEFAKYGVGFQEITVNKKKQTVFAVVDTETGKIKTGADAYKVIYQNAELQHLFVNIGEDPRFAQSCVDAQYEAAMGAAGKVPSWAKNFDEKSSRLGAHLTHWMPAIGWGANNYSGCTSDVGLAVQIFCKLGQKVEGNAGTWTKSYKSVVPAGDTYVVRTATGGGQLRNIDHGSVWADLKAAAGSAKAISAADIASGKYAGKILFEDNKKPGTYYVFSQNFKG